MATDGAGVTVEEVHYKPFGATHERTGSVELAHKYTSQEQDGGTGLYYYGARYYDPELGRFITPDSIVPYSSDPQSFNRYSYVRNNPVVYTDPSGHSVLDWFEDNILDPIGAFFAAAGGAIGGAFKALVTGGDVWRGMIEGAQLGIAFYDSSSGFLSGDTGGDVEAGLEYLGPFVVGFVGGLSGSYTSPTEQLPGPSGKPPSDVARRPFAQGPPGFQVSSSSFMYGDASAGQGLGDLSVSEYEGSKRSVRDGLGDDGIRPEC